MLDPLTMREDPLHSTSACDRGQIDHEDRGILRELAKQVAEVAALPIQAERARLWRALNRCEPERAMVLAQTTCLVPETDLQCKEPLCRQWEWPLRWKLYRHEHIRDDYPCTDFFDIRYTVDVGDYGVKEERIYGEIDGFGAYKVDPAIKSPEDFEKLRPRRIAVDHEATNRRVETAEEILGDILQVRKQGEALCRNMLTRKLIHLRGFDQFLLDMYDNPDLLHRMMAFLRDETLREWEIYEREGVLSLNNSPDHIRGTGGVTCTDELPSEDFDGHVRMQDMVCFGESQESVGVGPDLFNEFVLQYQLPLMNRFGSVDYGCCEPQDGKFDLLFEHIPRLCSVSVLPWGSREEAAERLADRHVYAYKPHPGVLELPEPDYEAAKKEMRETLEIAAGCCVSLTMKAELTADTADRATRWTDIAQRVVAEAA
jgi:hypothetical protein